MMQPVVVDTNILARAPLQDDLEQQALAQRLLLAASKGPGLVVSCFALLELAWVLKARKVPRQAIAKLLRALMESEGVTLTHRGMLHEALTRYEAGAADLGECLIHADGIEAGAGGYATFDRVPQAEGWALDPKAWLDTLDEG